MSDSNLLNEISKLRGSINSYKSEKKDINSTGPYSASGTRGNSFRGRGRGGSFSFRGSVGRGGRGRFPIRNRTLIVNNNSQDSDYVSTVSSNGYKLINKSVYDKELSTVNLTKEEKAAALAKAKEKFIQKKLELRSAKNKVRLDFCDRCLINGDLYAISRYGAKLVLLEPQRLSPTESIEWNGYKYSRGKNGNLKLLNEKVFLKEQCRYFQKTGECSRGTLCKYAHNSSKIALCRRFVKGHCTLPDCKLSHEFNEFNTPNCHFHIRGSCQNTACPFSHVNPELELICRPFAIGGYCFRGKTCDFIHSFECPDYQLTRECPRGKNCRLLHSDADNLDARLTFSSFSPEYLQLPDLTTLDGIDDDPRIRKTDIEDDISRQNITDDDDDDDDLAGFYNREVPGDGNDNIEQNKDFIGF